MFIKVIQNNCLFENSHSQLVKEKFYFHLQYLLFNIYYLINIGWPIVYTKNSNSKCETLISLATAIFSKYSVTKIKENSHFPINKREVLISFATAN